MFLTHSTIKFGLLVCLLFLYFAPPTLSVLCLSCLALYFYAFSGQEFTKTPTPTFSKVHVFRKLKSADIYLLKFNPTQGYDLVNFLHFYLQFWHYVDLSLFGLRFLALFLMSLLNSFFGIFETVFFHRAVQKQPLNPSPVFVLGHPRSGTTLVHNLLSLNKRDFFFPSTFFCGNPNFCLLANPLRGLFAGMIEDKRPMDNVPLSLDVPQEDELATNLLSGGVSSYSSLNMMQCEAEFRQFNGLLERDAAMGTSRWEFAYKVERWKKSFLFFLKKCFLQWNPAADKQIVLKSPVHTARGKTLLEIFPRAKFVYIHRDPFRVFQSSCHLIDHSYVHAYLAQPSDARVQDFILQQYRILFQEYLAFKQICPKDQLMEISYQDLTADLPETMRKIHTDLLQKQDMPHDLMQQYRDFDEESKRNFKKNALQDLDPDLKQVVYEHWKDAFEFFGYKK